MKRFSLLPLAALLLCGLAPSASAQTVQSKLTFQLTFREEVFTTTGVRIASVRVGTREMIAALMEAMGISGRRTDLVIRRDIDDLDVLDGQVILIVDGAEFPVPSDFISNPPLVLPDAFDASVSGFSLRRSDLVVQSQDSETIGAILIGDLQDYGFEVGTLAYQKASIRLKTNRGVDIGYLLSRAELALTGGILVDFLGPSALPLTGKIGLGSERIIAP